MPTASPPPATRPVPVPRRPGDAPLRTAFVTGGSGFLGAALLRRLVAEGVRVRALARSEAAARTVAALGAEPVPGELLDGAALRAGMRLDGTGRPVDVVFHVAGHLDVWGPPAAFERTNVAGTAAVIAAARETGVPALVAAGAAAVLMTGTHPLADADDSASRAWALDDADAARWAPYITTKARAEALVRAANTMPVAVHDAPGAAPTLRTVVVHPPAIWGAGDAHTLPALATAARRRRLVWIVPPGDRRTGTHAGRYPYATCHVANVAEALVCAALRGRGGASYLVTDGPEPDGTTLTFRAWAEGLLATAGIRVRAPGLPFGTAWIAATWLERGWSTLRLPGTPPITRVMLRLIGLPVTLRDDAARRELGYVGRVSRADGLAAMRAHAPAAPARPWRVASAPRAAAARALRRLACGVLGWLVASRTGGAQGSAASRPASVAGADTLLAGSWVLDPASDTVRAALERGIAPLSFVVRPIARRRLAARNPAYPRLVLRLEGDSVRIAPAGLPALVAPRAGAPVSWRSPDGETMRVRVRVEAAAEGGAPRWTAVFAAVDGERVDTFTLAPDGRTLQLHVRLTSPRLPAPITYVLAYRRPP